MHEQRPAAGRIGGGLRGIACVVLLSLTTAPAARALTFYRLQSVTVLPGAAPAWDYLTFDATRDRLFLDRRKDGVSVFDVATRRVVATIADSQGANATILVPADDLGYTVNGDGTTTRFRLSTLRTQRRIRFGRNADAGSYEPVTGQLVFTMGDSGAIAFMDARSGAVTATLPMPSRKLEASAPDGHGNVFMAEQDRNAVTRIDARRHAVTAVWSTLPCRQPTGLAYDASDRRIFVGCRSGHPLLAVLDADSGMLVATVAIGRGNDGVAWDAARHAIITANGVDANLVIVRQVDADHYRLEQAVTTQPTARTLAFDSARDRIFLVNADGAVDPRKKILREVAPFYPNVYFDNSYRVLVYARH
ncbi:MAG: YncE family protein [Xanthomonadaceae bacterium]|nr:YncE family protein [Xanthomonadaceae bacterium]